MALRSSQRITDLVLAAVLLPILALPILLISLVIFLDSPGPVVYRARRIGLGGKPFLMLKFRTMRHGADGPSLTEGGDGRITAMGRLLRTSRLDELPQLWNVIRGDMALVGPRPELEEFVDVYRDDYERILTVPPGLTGPTQLEFAAVEAHLLTSQPDPGRFYAEHVLPRKVLLDLKYAESHSLAGDLRVLFGTARVVFRLAAQRLVAPFARHRGQLATYALGAVASTMLLLAFVLGSGAPR